MAETLIDKQHTKITLGLTISLVAAITSGVWWASNIDTRLASQEEQTAKQWQKLSRIETITLKQAEIMGELRAIRTLLEQR